MYTISSKNIVIYNLKILILLKAPQVYFHIKNSVLHNHRLRIMILKIQGKSPENNFTKFINSLKKRMCYDPPISTLGNINVYEQRSSLKDAHQRIIIIKIWKQSKSSKIRLSKLSFTLHSVYLKWVVGDTQKWKDTQNIWVKRAVYTKAWWNNHILLKARTNWKNYFSQSWS